MTTDRYAYSLMVAWALLPALFKLCMALGWQTPLAPLYVLMFFLAKITFMHMLLLAIALAFKRLLEFWQSALPILFALAFLAAGIFKLMPAASAAAMGLGAFILGGVIALLTRGWTHLVPLATVVLFMVCQITFPMHIRPLAYLVCSGLMSGATLKMRA